MERASVPSFVFLGDQCSQLDGANEQWTGNKHCIGGTSEGVFRITYRGTKNSLVPSIYLPPDQLVISLFVTQEHSTNVRKVLDSIPVKRRICVVGWTIRKLMREGVGEKPKKFMRGKKERNFFCSEERTEMHMVSPAKKYRVNKWHKKLSCKL